MKYMNQKTKLLGLVYTAFLLVAAGDYLGDDGGRAVKAMEYDPNDAFMSNKETAKKLSGSSKNVRGSHAKKGSALVTSGDDSAVEAATNTKKNPESGPELTKTTPIYVNSSSFEDFEDFREIIADNVRLRLNCVGVRGRPPPSHADKLGRFAVEQGMCTDKPTTSVNRYVLLSQQHSGTSWLSNSLSRHPQVYMTHEIMFARNLIGLTDEEYSKLERESVTLAEWGWQNSYYESICMLATSEKCIKERKLQGYNSDGNIAAGFGVQGNQGWFNTTQLKTILPIWKENNVRVLMLERRNKISHRLASSATATIKRKTDEDLAHLTYHELSQLKDAVEKGHTRVTEMEDSVKAAGLPMHYVTYESLARDPGAEYAKIFDFLLGDDSLDTTSRWKVEEDSDTGATLLRDSLNHNWTLLFGGNGRRHKKSLKDRIGNYDEAMKTLSDVYPEGACMLDENCDWFYEP